MEGLLELRPPGIMGKWEEKFFRLNFDALQFFDQSGRSYLGEFAIDQITDLALEAPEINFTCQGRKNRLRARDAGSIQGWYQKLQSFIGQGPNSGRNASPSPNNARPKSAPPPQAQVKQDPGKSRVDLMYEQHQKKLDKLQDIREKEAMDEQKRLQDETNKNLYKGRKPPAHLSQTESAHTCDRLFNEHKFIQQRKVQKRLATVAKEDERIAETRRVNLPTRSTSDPALLTSREAGDRLYSDAERRELWKTQARDAQAKNELTMVKIGSKGSSASSTNRCNDLHKEAATRKEKVDKVRAKKAERRGRDN